MEDFISCLYDEFDLKDMNPNTLSPLVLAYIGDSVYETVIRTIIVNRGNMQVNKMHNTAKNYVSAKAQAQIVLRIKETLSEEEMTAFKRGRNAKSNTSAKNASITDYRNATGFEALIGYLYLNKKYERIVALIKEGIA